jgi:hypothetical protein
MDISLFGYKISVEVLVLIAILYLIIVGHSVCSCCNFYSLIEGMETVDASNIPQQVKDKVNAKVQQIQANTQLPAQTTSDGTSTSTTTGTTTTTTEGFTGANINYGESSLYDLDNNPIDTSSWSAPDMTIRPGQPVSAGVKAFMARPQQQLPLPEGEMDFFANADFKPECCPSSFSTSAGCWCGTSKDYTYLQNRASNNVPYSEY